MQLACETLDIYAAIRELDEVIPIAALQNVIAHRAAHHRERASLHRRLILLRAEQLKREVAA